MKILTPKMMKQWDREMEQKVGVSSSVLMERAALGVVDILLREVSPQPGTSFVVLAGYGNNGADGLVIGRILSSLGFSVSCLWVVQNRKPTDLCQLARNTCKASNIQVTNLESMDDFDQYFKSISNSIILIDALLGSGLDRDVGGFLGDIIDHLNERKSYPWLKAIVSVDLPSGLDGEQGLIRGTCVRADITIALGLPKLGQFLGSGPEVCGETFLVPLYPMNFLLKSDFELIDLDLISSIYIPRDDYGYKNSFGHLALVGGFPFPGALHLATKAALRSGVGLVSQCFWNEKLSVDIKQQTSPDVMPVSFERLQEQVDRLSAVVLGPGLESSISTKSDLKKFLERIEVPTVIDAGALNLLEKRLYVKKNFICTPHPGELSRMLKITSQEIAEQPIEALKTAFEIYRMPFVLKLGHCILALHGDGTLDVALHPNSYLSRGGSGDTLAGLLGSFLAQGYSMKSSVRLSIYLLFKSAQKARFDLKTSGECFAASDLPAYFGEVFRELSHRKGLGHVQKSIYNKISF